MINSAISEFISLEANYNEQRITFFFKGRLDTDVSTKLSEVVMDKIKQLYSDGFQKENTEIIFDLDKATFVSSFFLRVCFVALKEVRKGNFIIANASQQINSILKMSGLEKVTKILNKEEDVMVFPPSSEFSNNAYIKSFQEYKQIYTDSIENNEEFWKNQALQNIKWYKEFDNVLEWNLPNAKWFLNGKLNVCYNCVDKHLNTPIEEKAAIIWEGEPYSSDFPTEKKVITYKQLHKEVSKFANVLKDMGVQKGDRVMLYMPMIPESIYSMLACARIGAIHSVVFAGFSPQSIADRIIDCGATFVITADESYRRGKLIPLKGNVEKAIEICEQSNYSEKIKNVLMIERTGNKVNFNPNIDINYSEVYQNVSEMNEPEIMDSEDTLFILYTSGSTGKPKGIFHSSAGYLLGANLTFKNIMDIKNDDIFW